MVMRDGGQKTCSLQRRKKRNFAVRRTTKQAASITIQPVVSDRVFVAVRRRLSANSRRQIIAVPEPALRFLQSFVGSDFHPSDALRRTRPRFQIHNAACGEISYYSAYFTQPISCTGSSASNREAIALSEDPFVRLLIGDWIFLNGFISLASTLRSALMSRMR